MSKKKKRKKTAPSPSVRLADGSTRKAPAPEVILRPRQRRYLIKAQEASERARDTAEVRSRTLQLS